MLQHTRHVLFVLLGLVLAAATPTFAASTGYGTPAYSTAPLTLFEGPGAAYQMVGAIADDLEVSVLRCQRLWCVVENGHQRGWTSIRNLNFGHRYTTRHPIGPGQICLFEGRNYTGASVCIRSGQTFNDLLLNHLDNRFSSVRVEGNASAALCRDRNFQSYCERVITSQPVLNRYLDNQLSSVRVD